MASGRSFCERFTLIVVHKSTNVRSVRVVQHPSQGGVPRVNVDIQQCARTLGGPEGGGGCGF